MAQSLLTPNPKLPKVVEEARRRTRKIAKKRRRTRRRRRTKLHMMQTMNLKMS